VPIDERSARSVDVHLQGSPTEDEWRYRALA
jgi:hypothetical protein